MIIKWDGGDHPPAGNLTVRVRFRNGVWSPFRAARSWLWNHADTPFDIVAYEEYTWGFPAVIDPTQATTQAALRFSDNLSGAQTPPKTVQNLVTVSLKPPDVDPREPEPCQSKEDGGWGPAENWQHAGISPGSFPTDAKARKLLPIYSGFVKYFPDAIIAVAELSQKGNDQHNPGTPLHWDRSKSGDELDALSRHLLDAGAVDTDGVRHSTKVAWRALANLQKEIERDRKPEVS